MILCRSLALSLLGMVLASVATTGGAEADSGRLAMLRSETGGAPIARWRLHAKVLESLPEARQPEFIVRYGKKARLGSEEVVILVMALGGANLALAARAAGIPSRIPQLEEMLRREQRAGELMATGTGLETRIVVIWPPPGHSEKGSKKAK